MMQYFQNFEYEIKINIFKYINSPLNLILTCRNWSVIAKDSYAKTEWLIEHHGKEHALFHAVRLGVTFIDMTMCQSLIERRIITSRHLIQILLKHFRMHNKRLIELRIEHNFGQFDADKDHSFRQKIQSSWASNLIMFVFNYFLNEKQSTNAEKDLPSKDTELVNTNFSAAGILKNNINNLKDIEGLMNKFITFSLKSPFYLDFNSASYVHQTLLIPDKYSSSKNNFDAIKFFDFLQKNIFLRYINQSSFFFFNFQYSNIQ
jgi:hypothetical protein